MLNHVFEKLESLERIKHTLKDVDGKFDIPGVVVCGSQSSGKSSVLESATGLAFPRSEGMCTRVPAIVTVSRCSDGESPGVTVSSNPSYTEDVSMFADTDTSAFSQAVCKLTNKLAPDGRIRDSPIYVKYLRETGPTFTLTDLPGITCISKAQDDVETQTIDLTRKYISNSNALLLVVLPASEDFHNSKALKLAEDVDPNGERTIGVVTKVDSIPPGSDIVGRMTGASVGSIELAHGFFAVRNRTQEEVESGISLKDVVAKEEALFAYSSVLSQLPSELPSELPSQFP
jgi:dynamin 1-like protein